MYAPHADFSSHLVLYLLVSPSQIKGLMEDNPSLVYNLVYAHT